MSNVFLVSIYGINPIRKIFKNEKTTISIDSNVLSIDYLHFFVVEILDETKKMTNEN